MTPRRHVVVRPRTDEDLDRCEQIAREARALDGYPASMPDDRFRAFLASPDALGAWVAVIDGSVVGHVALHERSHDAVMRLATTSLCAAAQHLAVVARLFVSPRERGNGVGRLLLDHAATEARRLDRAPILDVAVTLPAAIALYERNGWESALVASSSSRPMARRSRSSSMRGRTARAIRAFSRCSFRSGSHRTDKCHTPVFGWGHVRRGRSPARAPVPSD